jgi:hypothetical protein
VARRARTAAGLAAALVALTVVAVNALPPAAGAAAPLLRPSRTASSTAADKSSPAPAIVVVIAGTVRPVPHPTRPHPSSSAAFDRSPRDAFRAAPLAGHPTTLLIVLVVPARGPRAPPCGAEAADRFAVAGGDPVNEADPTGLDNCSNAYPSGSTAYNRCEWLQANNGYQAPSFWSVAWNAAGAGAGGAWDYVTSPVQAVVGFAECQGSFGTCFNQNFNPVYGLLVNGQAAWEGWSDPCVSASQETLNILQTAQSADATAAVAIAPVAALERLGYFNGREFSFGRNFRISPFGNADGANWFERVPHYHRRVLLPNGDTVPGQGIGWHRPWQKW